MPAYNSKKVRTQNSHAGWTPKVTKSEILVCKSCKVRYIKTRPQQVTCIKCMLTPLKTEVFHLRKD